MSPGIRQRLGGAVVLLASAGLVWGVTALALVLIGRGASAPRTVELVIPQGAARQVAAGENPLAAAPTLSFTAGDVLRIVNHDAVTHRVGPYAVPPGRSLQVVMQPSAVGAFLCTAHPSGRITFDVAPRGLDLRLTVLPTLLLGLPLGAVVLGVRRVLRALETP